MKLGTIYRDNKIRIFYFVALAVLLFLCYRYRSAVSSVVKPFIIAVIISYLLNPVVGAIEKKGIKRIICVLIVYLVFILVILFFALVIVPILVKDIGILVENLPKYSDRLQSYIKHFQDGYIKSNLPQGFKDMMDDNITKLQGLILAQLQGIANSIIKIFSKLFYIVIIPIITFYLLKDAGYFKNQMILLIPKSKRTRAIILFRDIDNVFGKFIRGQIIVATFVGIMTTTALVLIKVKYAVVLGIFAGVSNIIPYFGPIMGIIPTVVFAMLDSPTKAIYAALAFIAIQQVESGILTPKVIGESVGIHPVYVMLSLIIGGKLFGIAGMVIAVPALAAIKLTLRHILRSSVPLK